MKLRILDPFVIVYAWVMACATIICGGGKRGKEYPPLGDPRIMRRAINFFFSPLPPIPRHCPRRFEEEYYHYPPPSFPPDGICFLPLHSISFFPSDISMVKSNFSPLDSHRLTYGQHGGEAEGEGELNVFLSNFNPSALVLRPGFYIPTSNLPFHRLGSFNSIQFQRMFRRFFSIFSITINRWDQDQDELYVRTFV